MKIINLVRTIVTPFGIFGQLYLPNNYQTFWTIERHWLENSKGISCIPAGVYETFKDKHNGAYDCIELKNVPNRSQIQIHIANEYQELNGCIGIGKGLGFVHRKWAVTNSRLAMSDLMRQYEEDMLINIQYKVLINYE